MDLYFIDFELFSKHAVKNNYQKKWVELIFLIAKSEYLHIERAAAVF